ncbi:MAG: hypothetical protein NT099_06530 [Candidatus Saganbacteria bacterium]|nr:hypothetical protein [Candidatus Saganbacteria bacterium]
MGKMWTSLVRLPAAVKTLEAAKRSGKTGPEVTAAVALIERIRTGEIPVTEGATFDAARARRTYDRFFALASGAVIAEASTVPAPKADLNTWTESLYTRIQKQFDQTAENDYLKTSVAGLVSSADRACVVPVDLDKIVDYYVEIAMETPSRTFIHYRNFPTQLEKTSKVLDQIRGLKSSQIADFIIAIVSITYKSACDLEALSVTVAALKNGLKPDEIIRLLQATNISLGANNFIARKSSQFIALERIVAVPGRTFAEALQQLERVNTALQEDNARESRKMDEAAAARDEALRKK